MSASWPMAALEAQAVASRTYAITSDAGGAKFDVYSDDRSQVYLGKTAETSRTNSAVAATAGQIVTYAGKPAVTYFFAGSGGQTESVQNAFPGAEPTALACERGRSLRSRTATQVDYDDESLPRPVHGGGLVKGAFTGIEVVKRGVSPRIVSAYVLGSKGRTLVSGPELEARLGLYSTWAYFSVKNAKGVHYRSRTRADRLSRHQHRHQHRRRHRHRHRTLNRRRSTGTGWSGRDRPARLRAGRLRWTARAACRRDSTRHPGDTSSPRMARSGRKAGARSA